MYACAWCGARARAGQETAAIFYRPTANGGRARGESRKFLSRGHLSLNHIFLPAPLATRQPLEPAPASSRERPASWRGKIVTRKTTRSAARSSWRKSFVSTSDAGKRGGEGARERAK